MPSNQLYLYLNYILEKRLNNFPMYRDETEHGEHYINIPLENNEFSFQHSEYGEVRVREAYLTCFENVTINGHKTDLHYTFTLVTSNHEVTIDIYQDEEYRDLSIIVEHTNHPEQEFVLSLDDLKILNDRARQVAIQIHHYFQAFLIQIKQDYNYNCYIYNRLMPALPKDKASNVLKINHANKMLINLEILSLFEPENHQDALLRLSRSKSQYLEILEFQTILEPQTILESAPYDKLLEKTLLIQNEFLNVDIIKMIKGFCYILNTALQQSEKQFDIQMTVINQKLKIHVEESIQTYRMIQEHLKLVNPLNLSHKGREGYEFCLTEMESIKNFLNARCVDYFYNMIFCQNYVDFDLIESYLNIPEKEYIQIIILNEHHEILPRVMELFKYTLTERLFDTEPHSIIDLVLQEERFSIFAELIHHFSLDYTYRLEEKQSLVMKIYSIDPENAWKLIENYEHKVLSSHAPVAEKESLRARITARNEFISQMGGTSESTLALEYEYAYALKRICEIEKMLNNLSAFSFVQNFPLVEEKNRLLLLTKLCNAISPHYFNNEVLQNFSHFKF